MFKSTEWLLEQVRLVYMYLALGNRNT